LRREFGQPALRTLEYRQAPGGLMGEGLFQPLHLILIIAIILLIFGTSKFASLGKGMGEGIRNFKAAMKDPEEEKKKEVKEEEKKS
jgi:sec-independent protein translocase protein TatA